MSIIGRISEWDDNKGYGFISVDKQAPRIIFHLSDLSGHSQRPRLNERVEFTLTKDDHGSFVAKEIERPIVFGFSLAITVWFITVVCSAVWLIYYPPIVLLHYVFLSSATYLVYLYDRGAEVENRTRIPELVLHTLSFIGGWPGAVLAQTLLRYQSSEESYRYRFWCAISANIMLFAYTFSAPGEQTLYNVIQVIQSVF
ncbi:DUF1294 domain-containing protein [Vibrio sp. YMD68]|uniref:DUF1294 domain-containing protein n=1 Tax=Vibrio sp. YMD68 TaxID=3042300 RepID=UPI00249A8877|nr:DUF1294 domain-containing protein [Vibrio sp. YMD68]WGV98391.1 DUF1294 domain-containing protein [Vibrio sp. YMD68]